MEHTLRPDWMVDEIASYHRHSTSQTARLALRRSRCHCLSHKSNDEVYGKAGRLTALPAIASGQLRLERGV